MIPLEIYNNRVYSLYVCMACLFEKADKVKPHKEEPSFQEISLLLILK